MSIVMLLFGIIAAGILFYRVMAVFFVPLFLAAALIVIFRPVHIWLLEKLNNRRRTAAAATTALILLIVLMPFLAITSVAATQFTAAISQLNINDLTRAIDRGRTQFGLSLEHPEQFRRLDKLADSLDNPNSDKPLEADKLLARIEEAKNLVTYLQENVDGAPAAENAEAIAKEKLNEFVLAIKASKESQKDDLAGQVAIEEDFRRQSVVASASIRAWMHSLLGGSFRSQARLLANPSESEFTNLLSRTRETLQPRFVNFTSATGEIVIKCGIGLVILVIACYFFFIDGPAMVLTLMRLSPLDDDYERRLLNEFDKTSRAVVLASLASAVAQGFLAAVAFYFLDFDSYVLLFLLTCLMSLIPFLGAASVWIPCAIYLGAVEERWLAAGFLAVYGAAIVSSVDNVIKAYVLHDHSQLHPLFALLSVLGGVHVFGPIGILVGPMVVVFLQTLLEILNHELGADQEPNEPQPETVGSPH